MEGAFGANFDAIRIHAGSKAAELNTRIQAKAFTVGNDIFFRDGAPDTSTQQGQHLLAHELTHTIQQGGKAQRFDESRTIRRSDDLAAQIAAGHSLRSSPEDPRIAKRTAERLEEVKKAYVAGGGAGGTGGEFDKSLEATKEDQQRAEEQIAQQKKLVQSTNDLPQVFWHVYKINPALAIKQFGLTMPQLATLAAREAGKTGEAKHWKTGETITMDNFTAFMRDEDDAERQKKDAKKGEITAPDVLFNKTEIANHLGAFKGGAHTFIDIASSKRILGWLNDKNGFFGWGVIKQKEGKILDRDSNFVAPLDEANAANAKAQAQNGIETLENDLGIPNKNWSSSNDNPGKNLMRWVIPKPKLDIDNEAAGVLLKMVTGREVGADPTLWVAGGFTKGGAREAKIDAIPREDLLMLLAAGEIKQKIEHYPTTGDEIPWGAGQDPVVGKSPVAGKKTPKVGWNQKDQPESQPNMTYKRRS